MNKDNQKAPDTDAASTRFARKKILSNTNTNGQSGTTSSIQVNNQHEEIGRTTRTGSNRTVAFPTLLGGPGDSIIFQDIALYRNKPATNSHQTPVKPPINSTNVNNALINQPAQLKPRQVRNRPYVNQNTTVPSQQRQNLINKQIEEKPSLDSGSKEQFKKTSLTKETQTNSGSAKKIVQRVVDVTIEERQAIDHKVGSGSKQKIERKVQKTQRNRGLKFAAEKTETVNSQLNDQVVNITPNIDNKFSKVTVQATSKATVQPQKAQKQTIQPSKIQKTVVEQPTLSQVAPPTEVIPTNTASQPYQRQNRYQGRPKIQSEASIVPPAIKQQQKQPPSIEVQIKQQTKQIKPTPKGPNKIQRSSLKTNAITNEKLQTNQNSNQGTGQKESKQTQQSIKHKSTTERPSVKSSRVEINPKQAKTEQIPQQIKPKPALKGKRAEIIQQQVKKEQTQKQVANQLKSKVQQQKPIKVEQVKTILKKTSVVMLTVKRLNRNKLSDAFKSIIANSKNQKLHLVTQFSIFYSAMQAIAKIKQINLLKIGFQTIKRKFITVYTSELKGLGDYNPSKNINAAANLLERLSLARIRQAFIALSWKSKAYLRRVGPLLVLQRLTKKKQAQKLSIGFEKIRLIQLQKKNSLNRLASIVAKVYIIALNVPFSKLITQASKSSQGITSNVDKKAVKAIGKTQAVVEAAVPDNPALIEKVEKIKTANASVTQEISGLESKVKEKKKKYEQQKNSKAQNMRLLKQQNQQLQTEINSKKQIGAQFQQDIQTEGPKPQEEQHGGQLTEIGETKLSILTNLYITHYRNADQPLQPAQITANLDLQNQDSLSILTEWRTILQNTELKGMIASYEKVNPKSYKSRGVLLQEQALAHKLIRSYIKQQYFWEWIHLSAH